MNDLLKKIDEKLDVIAEDIVEIKLVQAKQAKDLEHHIRRTDLAEKRLEIVEKELKPLKGYVDQIKGVLKFLAVIATVSGIWYTLIRILSE